MVVVAVVCDADGNVLVDIRFVAGLDLGLLERQSPMLTSLVVVRFEDSVLMIFDSWRRLAGVSSASAAIPPGTMV
jgi:hypothetical protein